MHQTVKYIVMLLTVLALQLFFADALFLGMYTEPLIYVAFIILLPMNLPSVATLACGLLTGVVMDLCTGMGGACTAATLLTAFMRRPLLDISVGKEIAADGGMPSADSLSWPKFLRYAAAAVGVQCVYFFALETMSWSMLHITLLRMLLSGLATLAGVVVVSVLFSRRRLFGNTLPQ